MLHLHNTLTRSKEPFTPLDAARVRMYVCGPTVYDLAHIGNARPVVVFDVLFRLLRILYGPEHVVYARNITDVDDKIIAAAAARGEGIDQLTERTARIFHEDVAALGALPPTIEPRATLHIEEMIRLIERLLASGHAYQTQDGVLFSVASLPEYGRLSRRTREELRDGARVEPLPSKRDPADFALWKPAGADEPGWESPFGRGRPGWHVECSAMSEAHLGETFDIHGGGLDLIFPHHENEIAQSEAAHRGAPLARYWLHNGFVVVDHRKMAKSLGNFRTIRDVLAEAPGEAARWAVLATHYRDPLDWTSARLQEARRILDRFYLALRETASLAGTAAAAADDGVMAALFDDLNTPLALGALQDLLGRLHKAGDQAEAARLRESLLLSGEVLGLLQADPVHWLTGEADAAEIDGLVAARDAARKARDFATADRIRKELAERGIVIEDRPDGSLWRRSAP